MTISARPFSASSLSWLALLGAVSCRASEPTPPATPATQQAPATVAEPETSAPQSGETTTLAQVAQGEQRSEANKARDAHRHPVETLQFFEVKPTSTVVELWPGGGWYTEILAPYLREQGKLIVTTYDPAGPPSYYGTRMAKEMLERFEREPQYFDKVEHVTVPQEVELDAKGQVESIDVRPFELAEPGTVDVVLTFRNSHGWFENDAQESIYAIAYRALKPGGIFGVVQHRAADGADPTKTAPTGYLPESAVIEAAQSVGFELAEKSEINANPKDTRNHPEGVWTLPPRLALEDKDRDRYLAIGESDRMTLKFVKPATASAAPSAASGASRPKNAPTATQPAPASGATAADH